MVPQSGPINTGAGPASDPANAMAQQLVDHIQGAEKRNKEQTAATGVMVTDQEAKENLVAEVAAMIKGVTPKPHKDSGKEGKESGKEDDSKPAAPSSSRKY